MTPPPEFAQVRVKYVATINDEALTEETSPDYELQYVDISNVDSSGTIKGIATYRFEEAPSRARRVVRDGDVIISTVRTYLQAIAPIQDPPENMIVSTGFAVVRPRTNVMLPGFCKYALRDAGFLAEVEMRSTGVSYPAINASDLGDIPVHVPSLHQQRVIAEYLDRETARIDALVAAKKRLLELLAEKRRAIVALATTRGLDFSILLRDSGLPWIGQIPKHWEIERAKWLFRERNERSEGGDEELLTVSHLTGVTPRSEKEVNMFEAESTEGYKVCQPGDLVINTLWAWMGAMGVSPVEGIVSPAYHVYTPCERLHPIYVDALVRTPMFATEVTRYSKGIWSSRLRLYPEGFFETWFPVPPVDEQRAIVAFIESKTSKLDELLLVAERSITVLQERRQSLITSAVTGQVKVER